MDHLQRFAKKMGQCDGYEIWRLFANAEVHGSFADLGFNRQAK
jgi:membrane associated rhomboid family serine protease